jgi:hypothetical protein
MFALVTLLLIVLFMVAIQKATRRPVSDQPDEPVEAAPPLISVAGASLFERPDEWSRVLRELPGDMVVTYAGADGRFLRVTTDDNVVGYVLASACIPDMDVKGPATHA